MGSGTEPPAEAVCAAGRVTGQTDGPGGAFEGDRDRNFPFLLIDTDM